MLLACVVICGYAMRVPVEFRLYVSELRITASLGRSVERVM